MAIKGRNILVGVTGGVAAYKALEVVRLLTGSGARCQAILTRSACELVRPESFEALTGRRAAYDLWESDRDFRPAVSFGEETKPIHIDLAQRADLFLIVPATANVLAEDLEVQAQRMFSAFTPFALATPQRGIERHTIAHVPALYAGTDLIDHASDIRSADMRQVQGQPGQTAPYPQVEVVEGHRSHGNDYRPCRCNRLRRLAHFHDLRPAVLAEECGVHRVASSSGLTPSRCDRSPGRETKPTSTP